MSERLLLVAVMVAIGAAIVVYGFNFGRKPRPGTHDDITGVVISSIGSALVGLGVGLRTRNPKLTATLPVVFALAYLPCLSAILWACILL
jgi:hypothetical protein